MRCLIRFFFFFEKWIKHGLLRKGWFMVFGGMVRFVFIDVGMTETCNPTGLCTTWQSAHLVRVSTACVRTCSRFSHDTAKRTYSLLLRSTSHSSVSSHHFCQRRLQQTILVHRDTMISRLHQSIINYSRTPSHRTAFLLQLENIA